MSAQRCDDWTTNYLNIVPSRFVNIWFSFGYIWRFWILVHSVQKQDLLKFYAITILVVHWQFSIHTKMWRTSMYTVQRGGNVIRIRLASNPHYTIIPQTWYKAGCRALGQRSMESSIHSSASARASVVHWYYQSLALWPVLVAAIWVCSQFRAQSGT